MTLPKIPTTLENFCFHKIMLSLNFSLLSIMYRHNSFQHQLSACHPSILKCIDALKREQSLHEIQIEQYMGGINKTGNRRKYRDCAQRLQSIVSCFDDTANVKEYFILIK